MPDKTVTTEALNGSETIGRRQIADRPALTLGGAARWLRLVIAVLALSLVAATVAPGAEASGRDPESPSGPANAVLQRAVQAVGGSNALTALERFEITATGANRIGYETEQPGDLIETSTYARTYTFDLDGEKLRVDTNRQPLFEAFQFLPPQSFTRVLDGNVGGITNGAGPLVPAGNLPSEAVTALRKQQRLFNPQLLLREALERPELVSYGGRVRLDGRVHRLLTIADDVAEIRLFIDQRSGLISKLETTENHPLVRDTPIEVRYHDWQRRGHQDQRNRDHRQDRRPRRSLLFPNQVELYADGALVWEETRIGVELEPSLSDDHFDLPPEATSSTVDADALLFGDQTHHLVEGFFALGFFYGPGLGLAPPAELAPGVTLLASGANTLVVEYDDGLVVLEAPNTPTHGSDIVNAVDQLAPGTPITHIVQSHHHVDHASGVRSLVAAGATAVVGNGVGEFWKDVLRAESTIRPDALSASGLTGVVEELDAEGTLVLGDNETIVTVHHTTFDPHAEDALITTIETNGQLFVFEADTYNAGFGFSLVINGPESFFDALRDLDIIDQNCNSALPLTIVPAHGFPQTLQASLDELVGLGIDVGC